MNKLLHFVIPALAPLATLAVHPDRCSGTVSVPTPYGPAKVEWKKDGKIATVETTIPPGFPGQVIEVGGVKITLPANPTACWMPFKAMSYDTGRSGGRAGPTPSGMVVASGPPPRPQNSRRGSETS